MNYYIQGDAAKAEEIKAAFEKLGFDVLDFGFADKTLVYCSIGGCGGCVQCLPYSINLMHILYSHPNYQELELPVEPKFKVGDWVVSPNGSQYLIAYIDKEDNRYFFEINEYTGEPMNYEDVQVVDGQYHLWTIADAKDGDVLVSRSDNPFIYNGNIEFSSAGAYVGVSRDGRIRLDFFPSKAWTSIKDVKPSTKEQRDLLFAKLREAGYTWDEKKKELKKIQSHYDIDNFHAGMPVLVRDYDNSRWSYVQFSHYVGEECGFKFNACGIPYIQCIPFNEETKHLLGTTNPCDERFINW